MLLFLLSITFEFPESFQRIVPCSYGDDVVHPPSGTKFDYEFGKKTTVFATKLLATFKSTLYITFPLECTYCVLLTPLELAGFFILLLFVILLNCFPLNGLIAAHYMLSFCWFFCFFFIYMYKRARLYSVPTDITHIHTIKQTKKSDADINRCVALNK